MPEIKSRPCFLTPKRLKPGYPLFVFLPGMDGTGQLFRAQTAGLEVAFDIRCLAIPPDDLTDWNDLAATVIELVKAELKSDSNRSVYLCGESFGGCLAMHVALQSPELFKRIILVNPASSFNHRPWINWGSQISRYLPEPAYQVSSVMLLPLLAYFRRMLPGDRQTFLETVSAVPQKTSIWRLSMLSKFNLSDAVLQKITQPILLIASAADLLLPSLTEAQRLKELFPNVQLIVLPESGHACLLEADIHLYEMMQAHQFLEEPSSKPDQQDFVLVP
jgi:pimeloyl-ACP methyl ester carboxylesterase